MANSLTAQYYFPPKTGSTWETTDPLELGWCQDSIDALNTYLKNKDSKAFIILKDGKIVLEEYYNNFGPDSAWYWASAGKTMMTFLIGRAQEQGLLNINDSVSKHLGTGWTNMTPSQEGDITIWHQLTMTTGIDFTQPDCTDPSCIKYRDEPGTFWYYYNPPYTLLRDVLESATSKSVNNYMFTEVSLKTGISGTWIKTGTNNVLFSKPRSMARFGSLMLNNGQWDGHSILGETKYLNDAVNTSQSLNKSYGYLWWLNGKESFRYPATTKQFTGSIVEKAPEDMYAGIGKNGQYVAVIPSENMVVVRMGDNPDEDLVPTAFANEMFERITNLSCTNSTTAIPKSNWNIYPNPIESSGILSIECNQSGIFQLYSITGELLFEKAIQLGLNSLEIQNLQAGIYLTRINGMVKKLIIQ